MWCAVGEGVTVCRQAGRVRSGRDGVVAVADVRDDVVAGAAGEGVVAVAAFDGVIARTTGDGVVAVAAVYRVIERGAGDGVVAVAAGDRLAGAGVGAVNRVISGSSGHRRGGLRHAGTDDAVNGLAARRGRDNRERASLGWVFEDEVAVGHVRGLGVCADRDFHVRIRLRPRDVTERYLVIWGSLAGEGQASETGTHQACHPKGGERSSVHHRSFFPDWSQREVVPESYALCGTLPGAGTSGPS